MCLLGMKGPWRLGAGAAPLAAASAALRRRSRFSSRSQPSTTLSTLRLWCSSGTDATSPPAPDGKPQLHKTTRHAQHYIWAAVQLGHTQARLRRSTHP